MTNVLIIETDEPPMRLLGWGLTQEGMAVTAVAGPEAATVAPRPDAVVMNTGMPPEEKRLWIGSLRYLLPGVIVIDLAAHDDAVLADSGADAYMYPPLRVDRVVEAIQQLCPADVGMPQSGTE